MIRINYTLFVFAMAAFFISGCAGTASRKAPSHLFACDKKYENIESSYIYPQDMEACYSRALNLDLRFVFNNGGMSTVKAYNPGSKELVLSASYERKKDESKIISTVKYFDAEGSLTKKILFDKDAKVSSTYYYSSHLKSPQNKEGIEKSYGYYYNAGGKITLLRLEDYTAGKTYESGFNASGVLRYVNESSYIEIKKPTPDGKSFVDDKRLMLTMHAGYNDDGSLKGYVILSYGPQMLPGIATMSFRADESISYDDQGNVTIFQCSDGECLKHNDHKRWDCGTACLTESGFVTYGAAHCAADCMQKAKQLKYEFKKIPLVLPEALQSKKAPDICALDIINFQCPKK